MWSSRSCPPKYQNRRRRARLRRSTEQRQDGAVVLTSTNMSESKKSVEDTLSSAIAQLEEEAALKKVSSVRGRPTVREVGEGRRWRKTVAFDV